MKICAYGRACECEVAWGDKDQKKLTEQITVREGERESERLEKRKDDMNKTDERQGQKGTARTRDSAAIRWYFIFRRHIVLINGIDTRMYLI